METVARDIAGWTLHFVDIDSVMNSVMDRDGASAPGRIAVPAGGVAGPTRAPDDIPSPSILISREAIGGVDKTIVLRGRHPAVPSIAGNIDRTFAFAKEDPLAWKCEFCGSEAIDSDTHLVGHALARIGAGGVKPEKSSYEAYIEECAADAFSVYMGTLRDGEGRETVSRCLKDRLDDLFVRREPSHWTGDGLGKVINLAKTDMARGMTVSSVRPMDAIRSCLETMNGAVMGRDEFAEFAAFVRGDKGRVAGGVKERLVKARAMFDQVKDGSSKARGLPVQDWQRKMMEANPERARQIIYGASLVLVKRALGNLANDMKSVGTEDIPNETLARIKVAANVCRFIAREEAAVSRGQGDLSASMRKRVATVSAVAEVLGSDGRTFSARRSSGGGLQRAERCINGLVDTMDNPAMAYLLKRGQSDLAKTAAMFSERTAARQASVERDDR